MGVRWSISYWAKPNPSLLVNFLNVNLIFLSYKIQKVCSKISLRTIDGTMVNNLFAVHQLSVLHDAKQASHSLEYSQIELLGNQVLDQ